MKTRTDTDKVIDRYLSQLDHALSDLPASRRREIIDEITSHITESRCLLDHEDEVSIRALLDRIGDPLGIAEEAGARRVAARPADSWVPWLLLFGGFALFVGWFVGVGLLWSSKVWRVSDKLIGTFVVPGGLLGIVLLSAWLVAAPVVEGIVVLVFAVVAPITTAVHLDRVRRAH
jgi:hypothetical protein